MTAASGPGPVVAVVLAGGRAHRFGADKLAADVEGRTLLARAVEGLPDAVELVVVGPERPLGRTARVVREDPPGGGPAAAMIAGVRAALDLAAGVVLVLPGDAPLAGRAAGALLDVLGAGTAWAAVAVDPTGRDQPLQLALLPSAARALVEAAGPTGASGLSARLLVARLTPPPHRVPLPAGLLVDLDTPADVAQWVGREAGVGAEPDDPGPDFDNINGA